MLKAINIKWDTDGDKEVFNELPTEMIVPKELDEDMIITAMMMALDNNE